MFHDEIPSESHFLIFFMAKPHQESHFLIFFMAKSHQNPIRIPFFHIFHGEIPSESHQNPHEFCTTFPLQGQGYSRRPCGSIFSRLRVTRELRRFTKPGIPKYRKKWWIYRKRWWIYTKQMMDLREKMMDL